VLAVELRRGGNGGRQRGVTERGLHRPQHDFRFARFHEDGRDAARRRELSGLRLVVVGRVEDHPGVGDGRVLPESTDEFVPVHGRHQNVGDHKVGPLGTDRREPLSPVGRLQQAVAAVPE
jgi:hypothetical protein